MQKILLTLFLFTSTFALCLNVSANNSSLKAKVKIALAADSRPDKDKKRDTNRLPLETLAFFSLSSEMTVVELIPGGGWYTRVLAPVLKEKGKLYVAYGTSNVEKNVLGEKGFNKVGVLAKNSKVYRPEDAPRYVLENADLGLSNVDMVLTFRNYHNFGPEGRKAMNNAVYKALKPGGIYGVVDHTRRHMESNNNENRRRFDPVLAIKEIESAGFEFVDFSDLHYRKDDKTHLEVGHEAVKGKTDRWTLKFKKK